MYRGISDFKKGCQPRIYIIEDKKGDWVTDSHSILATWRYHFPQLWKIHGVNYVRQTKIHTTESIVPEQSALYFEITVGKMKRHKSPGIDQIPTELIKAGGRTIRSEIHTLIISIRNKEKLPEEWKE